MFKTVGPVSSAIENVRTPYRFFDFEFLSFDIVSYFDLPAIARDAGT